MLNECFDSLISITPKFFTKIFNQIIWIKKYANKIIACHLKDFYSKDKNLQDHREQSPIGDGFIDWSTIIPEIKKTNCKIYAIEHDDPKDYKDYTTKSLNYLSAVE